MDQTDTSVHYTPQDKSNREKDLENQLKNETDKNRRRRLARELDHAKAKRQRRDRRDQRLAQDDADRRQQNLNVSRAQGGSRFKIRLDKKDSSPVTPEMVMQVLSAYVTFPRKSLGARTATP